MGRIEAHLSLGANLGDRAASLRRALEEVAKLPATELVRVSGVYETEPWGVDEPQPPYLNMAATIATALGPVELVGSLKAIERALGRPAATTNRPRVIDVDLLLHGQTVLNSVRHNVTVPHPEIAGRAFVLAPLREIAGGAVHPVTGETVTAMAARVDMGVVLARGAGLDAGFEGEAQ